MKQTYDETTLSAFIDGELDSTTMREVDLLLEKDKASRGYVLDAIRTTALLRADVNGALDEEIPERLLQAVNPQRPVGSRRKPALRHLFRVAAVLILGLLGFGTGMLMERNAAEQFPSVIAPLPARYGEVVDAALEYNLSGTPREWKTPVTAVAVTVTPVKTYRDKSGVYYREYRLEIGTETKRSQINGLAYRTVEGQWKTKALFFMDAENSV